MIQSPKPCNEGINSSRDPYDSAYLDKAIPILQSNVQWHKTLGMHIAPLIFRLNRAKASPPATVDGSVLESLCGCKDFLFFYFFLLQVMERAGRWGDGSKLAFSYVIRKSAPPPPLHVPFPNPQLFYHVVLVNGV